MFGNPFKLAQRGVHTSKNSIFQTFNFAECNLVGKVAKLFVSVTVCADTRHLSIFNGPVTVRIFSPEGGHVQSSLHAGRPLCIYSPPS